MADAKSKKLQPAEYFKQHYEQEVRPDGRSGLTSLRPVSISTGSITTADGSAVVKQGETIVICGIKLEISEPIPEAPKSGKYNFLIYLCKLIFFSIGIIFVKFSYLLCLIDKNQIP